MIRAGALLVDGTTTLAYDALGAVSRIQVGAEVRTLRRDALALGRVVTETNQAGAVTSYGNQARDQGVVTT